MQKIGFVFISLIGSIIIGVLLLILVYCFPVDAIRDHVRKSISIYEKEGLYYEWGPDRQITNVDNYADAVMLNIASFSSSESLVRDAMLNPRVFYADLDNQIDFLKRAVDEDTKFVGDPVYYPRYWHGYLVWLKPMLLYFTVSDIRIFSMCFQFSLIVMIILELYKFAGYKMVVPAVITVICMSPITTVLCLEFMSAVSVTLFSVFCILRCRLYLRDDYWKLFLFIGIITAYVDFLTFPIITLGINLILVLSLRKDDLRQAFKALLFATLSWVIGYFGMWVGKWVVSYLLTGYDTLTDAKTRIEFRLSGQVDSITDYSAISSIKAQLKVLLNKPIEILFLIFSISVIFLLLFKKYSLKQDVRPVLPIMFVGLYPFAWYSIVRNHSLIHPRTTYRGLTVAILAFTCAITKMLKKTNSLS